jgi:hypothetical protein
MQKKLGVMMAVLGAQHLRFPRGQSRPLFCRYYDKAEKKIFLISL